MIKDFMKKIPRYEKRIGEYIQARISTYYGHDKYKILKKRHDAINNSLDLKFGKNDRFPKNSFKTNFVIPLAREAFIAQRAITWNAFINDPLFSLSALGNTSYLSAKKMQLTLNTHLKNRKFRYKALMKHIDQCARYGATINYAYFHNTNSTVLRTVPYMIDGERYGYTMADVPAVDKGVCNEPIHVLNFFSNPEIANIDKTNYLGHRDRMPLSSFAAKCRENPYYIKKNVLKVIKEKKSGGDTDYEVDPIVENDLGAIGVTVDKGYYKLNFKDNEDDDTLYYVETVDNVVIRIHPNFNERNNTNIDVITFDKRIDSFFGNSSNEMQIPMEHVLHTVLQMEADAAIQRLQNYILYNADLGIDVSKLQESAKQGGLVPVWPRPGQNFRDSFFQTSFNNDNYRGIERIIQEVKESGQRVKPKPDLQREVASGGINNNTATAANMLKAQGDLVENFYLHQFANGLAEIGETNCDILKQYLAPFFYLREKDNLPPEEIAKEEILGDHGVKTETSYTTNNQLQAMNLMNVLTAIQNFKGTMDPTWQNVNPTDLARGWIKAVAPDYDAERIFPEQLAQPMVSQYPQPQAQQQIPMGAANV